MENQISNHFSVQINPELVRAPGGHFLHHSSLPDLPQRRVLSGQEKDLRAVSLSILFYKIEGGWGSGHGAEQDSQAEQEFLGKVDLPLGVFGLLHSGRREASIHRLIPDSSQGPSLGCED